MSSIDVDILGLWHLHPSSLSIHSAHYDDLLTSFVGLFRQSAEDLSYQRFLEDHFRQNCYFCKSDCCDCQPVTFVHLGIAGPSITDFQAYANSSQGCLTLAASRLLEYLVDHLSSN